MNMREGEVADFGQRPLLKRHEGFRPRPESERRITGVIGDIRRASERLPDWFEYYARNHAARIAFDLELLTDRCAPDATMVEFGACPLLLTAALHAEQRRVTGVDIDPARFSAAIHAIGLDVRACDIESPQGLPFSDGSFDVAIFNEIFEHLRINPIETFSELRRIVKPGGTLFLSTPNGRSLTRLKTLLIDDRALDMGIFDSYQDLATIGHMGHVREYTVTDVVEFLEKMGFRCEEVVYRGRFPNNFGQLVARALPFLRPFFSVIATRL